MFVNFIQSINYFYAVTAKLNSLYIPRGTDSFFKIHGKKISIALFHRNILSLMKILMA